MPFKTFFSLFPLLRLAIASPWQTTNTGPGNAIVNNNCPYPLYLWSVDQNTNPANPIYVAPYSSHSEPFRSPCSACGVSIKLSRSTSQSSIVQFEYALNNDLIYYDMSYINCAHGTDASACPAHERGMRINGDGMGGTCGILWCRPNRYCPDNAYYVPVPGDFQPVKTCGAGEVHGNLVMIMCSDA